MSATTSGDEIIAFTYPMNERLELRSFLDTYRGQRLGHIRFMHVSRKGKVSYSRNGICVGSQDLPHLHRAVEELAAVSSSTYTGGDDPSVVYRFVKNAHEEVAAYTQAWSGDVFAHLRVLRADENDQDWFTRKGISFPLEWMPVLQEATVALVTLAKEEQQALIEELDSE